MTAEWLLPFLAGLAAGVNPFTAPVLKARLPDAPDQHQRLPRSRVAAAAALVAAAVAAAVGAFAWWAGALVSTVLTYGLLIAGVGALLGALHAWQPLSGRGSSEPAPAGAFAWPRAYAGDVAFYAAPAWAVALAFSMRSLTPGAFVEPLAAAWAGVALATWAWVAIAPDRLPTHAPSKDAPPTTRTARVLAASYAVAALVLFGVFLALG